MYLIERQAAIDALSTPHGILYPIRTVEELPSVQQKHWIPCSERLPEDGERVLVTAKNGEVLFGSHLGKHWAFGSKVVAWMPLPEPYKEEHDERE